MKRFILAILSLLYLSSSTGASLRFHYCMGQLESWSLGHKQDKKCGGCMMEMEAAETSGCCQDEFKHIQLKVDQKSNKSVVFQYSLLENEWITTFNDYPAELNTQNASAAVFIDHRLRHRCTAIYIRDCNFRI